MKNLLIADLHKILFTNEWESAKDSFDLNIALAKAFLSHHHLYFKDKREVPNNRYWENGIEVSDHFFNLIAPGKVLSETAFTYICEGYFDLEMWETLHGISIEATDILAAVSRLKEVCERPYTVTMIVEAPQFCEPIKKVA